MMGGAILKDQTSDRPRFQTLRGGTTYADTKQHLCIFRGKVSLCAGALKGRHATRARVLIRASAARAATPTAIIVTTFLLC